MKYSPISFALLLCVAAALVIAVAGGGSIDLGVFVLSARRPWRAVAGAAILLGLRLAVARARRESAIADELIAVGFGSMVVAAMAGYFIYLARVAGGLDSYGYVSAAEAIGRWRLLEDLPAGAAAAAVPPEAAVPMGWVLSPDRAHMVPEFPFGFPLVLAFFRALGGPEAMFYAPPILAIGVVVVAFLFARRLGGAWTAALAAVLIGTNPVFFTLAIQPMSDVPATFWVVLGLAMAMWPNASPDEERPTGPRIARSSGVASVIGGVAAAMAILTRPPLLLAVSLLVVLRWRRSGRRSAVIFAAFALAGVAVQLLLQWQLYGNPLVSGHGSAQYLFTWAALPSNAANHLKWALIVHTPVTLAAIVCAFVYGHRALAAAAVAIFCAVAAPYLFYMVRFDDWEMLRFLLPGLTPLLIVAADGFVSVFKKAGRPAWIPASTFVIAAAYASWNYAFMAGQATFELRRLEARYPLAGEVVQRRTPADAVVLAVQHSGSLRRYGRRLTLKWDRMPPDSIQAVVAAGQPTYVLFDGPDEQEAFRRRFARALADVQLQPLARVREITLARLVANPASAGP